MIKILNTIHEDYHMHTLNYSDGMHTIDDIVQYAGKIGMKKIAITDHSQACIDGKNFSFRNRRSIANKRRKNLYNDVEVIFGIEWDLLDEEGNCCFDIQGLENEFLILSCHEGIYQWDYKNITQAYINAIHKYHDKIKFIGHMCYISTSKYLDIDAIIEVLNTYNIPMELNCTYLSLGVTDLDKLNKLLSGIKAGVYVNSDMHTLSDFSLRQAGFDYIDQYFKS